MAETTDFGSGRGIFTVSNTVTSSGASSSFDSKNLISISITYTVSAITGSGASISFVLEESDDGASWFALHTAALINSVTNQKIKGARVSSRFFRFSWTVAGSTPSITFAINTTLKTDQTIIPYSAIPGSTAPIHTAIVGAKDGSGNIKSLTIDANDRLKVDVAASTAISGSFNSKSRVDVLLSSVALTTGSYTNVYSYSGSGLLHGFNVEFNNSSVIIRLQIDGETIFSGNSIATLNGLLATGNDAARRQAGTGFVTSGSTLDFSLRLPLRFASSVVISADANGGVLLSRSFSQGIVYISKET